MDPMSADALKQALKTLIIEETGKETSPDKIHDDEPLLGARAKLELDSIDVLQISMALQKAYDVKIVDPKQAARVMKSISTLADYIAAQNRG
ncbi:MAG: phosphopantetheine-binding protein [Gammaproteobacteria bacterium]|nr:phosphopantetheine-binding protein [Gammaproteobacteria bacterium]